MRISDWSSDVCSSDLGAASWLAEFGLVEGQGKSYSARPRANAAAADGTVLFGNHLSTGSALTERYCKDFGKPIWWLPICGAEADIEDAACQLVDWLHSRAIPDLNVAGNRDSDCPGRWEAPTSGLKSIIHNTY